MPPRVRGKEGGKKDLGGGAILLSRLVGGANGPYHK